MHTINVVPREDVPLEHMEQLAARLRWKLDRRSSAAAAKTEFPRYVWKVDGGTVALVKNSTLRRDYFVIGHPDPGPIVDAIREHVPCYELAEIVELLTRATAKDSRVAALRLIAAAEPQTFDESVFRAIVDSADQPEPIVRLVAATAASHLAWRQLRDVLANLAESDESDPVRDASWNMLHLTTWDRG